MNLKDVRVGQLVTWDHGVVRGRIAVLLPASKECGVILTEDYQTLDGRCFKRGFSTALPAEVLRGVS
jgi:hypothetical protein